MELSNARRNQEQRNQLTQTLELKKSQLTLEKQTLARTRELVTGGLSPRADLDKAENAVTVRERDIAETEAALRVLTETSDRESDLKTRELEAAESELKLLKAGSRPEQIRQAEGDVAKLEKQVAILDQELGKTDIRRPDRRHRHHPVRRTQVESAPGSRRRAVPHCRHRSRHGGNAGPGKRAGRRPSRKSDHDAGAKPADHRSRRPRRFHRPRRPDRRRPADGHRPQRSCQRRPPPQTGNDR